MDFAEEADACRRKAHVYVGRPEATFLLRVAKEFDRLEGEHRRPPGGNGRRAKARH